MTPETPPIRILLVDDHEMVRLGLRQILSIDGQFSIVAEAATAEQAVALAQQHRPDVLILDIRLPDASGIEVTRQVKSLMGEKAPRILILTSFADERLIVDAIASGVDGYLLKEADREQLTQAIQEVAAGRSVLANNITRHILSHFRQDGPASADEKYASLSLQEKRVLALVAEGKTNKEIAELLDLSPKTVKNYLSHVLEKLGLQRRTQAAVFYSGINPTPPS